jgi:hypothetical protein
MAYHVTHWTGAMEEDFPESRFGELLDELSTADSEHPDLSMTHDSEWCLSFSKGGLVTLENLEEGEPRHRTGVGREECLDLMRALAVGDLEWIGTGSWQPGYYRGDAR